MRFGWWACWKTGGWYAVSTGSDRRQVDVALTPTGRRLAERAAAARKDVVAQAVSGLTDEDARTLERLVAALVETRVSERLRRRVEEDWAGAWWCRMCDFEACERPEGRCPATRDAE